VAVELAPRPADHTASPQQNRPAAHKVRAGNRPDCEIRQDELVKIKEYFDMLTIARPGTHPMVIEEIHRRALVSAL
jgi:hypothetical protein